MIYKGAPSKKLPLLATLIQAKMNEGYRCLYLNSAPMVAGLRATLSALGMDVADEVAKGRLIISSKPVSSGMDFNSAEMLHRLETSLDEALNAGFTGLWASGDMTWEFGLGKDFAKLVQYELELEQLFVRRKELCGVCQYHRDTLPDEVMMQGLLLHSRIVVNDTLSRLNPLYLKSSWPADLYTRGQLNEMLTELYAA